MVTSFLSAVTAFIAAYPHLAYAAVLLLALSESIPVIGVVVPGTAVILAVSALVPAGVVTLWPLLAAATAGAIIGDGFSFWIGHRYHREILNAWPLNRHPALVERSEAFFARHGDKSVFLARFTPGVRAFIPLLAGMLRMSPRRFYAANILSALVWAPAHILPGVLIGVSFSLFGSAAKPLAMLLVLLAVLAWAVIHVVRFSLRRGVPFLSAIAERVRLRLGDREPGWTRMVLSLLDPSRPNARALVLLTLVLVGAAWLFFGILEDVVSGDPLVRADTAIYSALQDLRTRAGDSVMITITELGDEAFHDVMASLLRGFDRAVLSTDATKPAYPAAMRIALAERLKKTRNYERLGWEKKFSTESHAADALTAMFFQRSGILPSRRPSVPDNWDGLEPVMPTLTDLTVNAASSGYLAVLFLELIETSRRPSLLPYLLEALGAWCSAYGPDTSFWVSHDVGGRACRWLKNVLPDGATGLLASTQERALLDTLDILVQAGVTSAREVEERLAAGITAERGSLQTLSIADRVIKRSEP